MRRSKYSYALSLNRSRRPLRRKGSAQSKPLAHLTVEPAAQSAARYRCYRHRKETAPVIKFHIADKGTLYSGPPDLTHPVPPEVLWIDICSPTKEEEAELEKALGLDVPTREEISEIEQTSRLYRSNGLLYMTAVIIARSDSLAPTTVPVTFIATPERVITVRYDTPTSFEIFQARCEKRTVEIASASDVLTGLLGTIVDRAADILELVGADLEALNREIFLYTGVKAKRSNRKQPQRRNLEEVIGDVGRSHDVVFRIRESLQSLERLFVFLRNNGAPWPDETERQVAALEEDVRSLQRVRRLSVEQGRVHAGCDARPGRHSAEWHHQDILGDRRRLHAADAGRQHLRHELRAYA